MVRLDPIDAAHGQTPMLISARADDLQRRFATFHEAGQVAATLCHVTALLGCACLSDGTPRVRGRTVTGFANVEDDVADAAVRDLGLVPRGTPAMHRRIGHELQALGANSVQASLWRSSTSRHGRLAAAGRGSPLPGRPRR